MPPQPTKRRPPLEHNSASTASKKQEAQTEASNLDTYGSPKGPPIGSIEPKVKERFRPKFQPSKQVENSPQDETYEDFEATLKEHYNISSLPAPKVPNLASKPSLKVNKAEPLVSRDHIKLPTKYESKSRRKASSGARPKRRPKPRKPGPTKKGKPR